MKKFLYFLLLFLVLTSCQNEVQLESENSLVSVTFLPVINKKDLHYSIPASDLLPVSYKFQAEPVSKNSNMKGSTNNEWIDLSLKPFEVDMYETTKRFSVGQWVFKIRAYNSNNALLYEGESNTVALKADEENVFTIELSDKYNTDANASGLVKLDVSVPRLTQTQTPGKLTVTFYDAATEQIITPSKIVSSPSGSLNQQTDMFDFSAKYSMKPGYYIVKISYSEGASPNIVSASDSIVAFRVIEGSDTSISGSSEGSLYASAIFTFVTPKSVNGTLTQTGKAGSTYTFKYTSQVGNAYLIPTSYKWYVDGVLKTSGVTPSSDRKTCSFQYNFSTSYGNHCITCIAIYSDSSRTSVYGTSIYADYVQQN